MFKCEITEYFGPDGGMGGYGSETRIGFAKSPKRAVMKAKGQLTPSVHRTSGLDPVTGEIGGNVSILRMIRLFHNGRLILDETD